MNKYSIISFSSLGLFILLSAVVLNANFSFRPFGKAVIAILVLLPLTGTILAFKGRSRFSKWSAGILNFIALYSVVYILLLSGMGED